jgi:hypothetical protein
VNIFLNFQNGKKAMSKLFLKPLLNFFVQSESRTGAGVHIVVHIFSLVQTMPLRLVGLEREVFLDAVVNICIFLKENQQFFFTVLFNFFRSTGTEL